MLVAALALRGAEDPGGFHGAQWGSSPAQVRQAANAPQWRALPPDNAYPEGLEISRYSSSSTVAGYPATVVYYFYQGRYFQATVNFDFGELENYDFNYNVFRSVDEYYRVIHDKTLTFVADIYDLLRKKYGKKQPIFKGLDPRYVFKRTDAYIRQERWNLRYNPSEYYKRIVTAAYARWDFPESRAIFSINISAADKRFDYRLSLASLDLVREINEAKDRLRMEKL